MSRLSDYELDQLLIDCGKYDSMQQRLVPPLVPRIRRLLEEQRELRDQAAEREHMAQLEGHN